MDSPIHASLLEAEYATGPGESLRLAVRVVGLLASDLVGGCSRRRLRLADLDGAQTIETTYIEDPLTVRRAAAALRSGQVLVANGALVAPESPEGKPRKGVALQLRGLAPAPPPSTLLGPSPQLLIETDQLLDSLFARSEGAFFEYLCERSFQHLGVDPTFSPRYQQTVHLLALQALSQGQLPGTTNGRLSVYVTAEPAQGKKILAQLADLWAPVSQSVQPSLLTPVGLSARTEQKQGGVWTSSPGAMPLCSGGVCIIDDFQRVEKRHQSGVDAILMSVMEDGRVAPVKASISSYTAACALLIIANRRSQAQGAQSRPPKNAGVVAERLYDLSLCGEVLSRCDVMVELHTGEDPALGAERQAQMGAPDAFDLPEEDKQAKRAIQLLVSRVRDRIKTVDLNPVKKDMGLLMRDVALVVRDQCASSEGKLDGDALLRRMANAGKKLVAAQARLCGRATATAADVDVAWDMLSLKMEMVGYICGQGAVAQPLLPRAEQVRRAKEREELRFLRLLHRQGGGKVTLEEAAQSLGLTVKQLGRELWKRGLRPHAGYLELPTLEEYKETEQARIAKEEREAEAAARRGELLRKAQERSAAPTPTAPPLEFWRAPEPREAEEVEQVAQALREPPPGDPALPGLPRRCGDIGQVLRRVPSSERDWTVTSLLLPIQPSVSVHEIDGAMYTLYSNLALSMEPFEWAPYERPFWELRTWVTEGEEREQWVLRALAVLAATGLVEGVFDLKRCLREQPMSDAVRAGVQAVLALFEQQRQERRQRERDSS